MQLGRKKEGKEIRERRGSDQSKEEGGHTRCASDGQGRLGQLVARVSHEFGSQTACALPHNMENGPSEAPCFREFVQMARFLIVVSLFPPRATVGCIWVSPLVLVFNALFCVCRPQVIFTPSRKDFPRTFPHE